MESERPKETMEIEDTATKMKKALTGSSADHLGKNLSLKKHQQKLPKTNANNKTPEHPRTVRQSLRVQHTYTIFKYQRERHSSGNI